MATPDPRSPILPTDAFDLALARLQGHPNGAATQPTVKHDAGDSIFVQAVNAAGNTRLVLPPKVADVIARQHDSVVTQVRRRHGKRLAEDRKAAGIVPPGFTPEARRKAAKTRARKAAERRRRQEGK
jgi:hypothetical protein